MNYRMKKKFGKHRFRKCKARAKHGGRCKKLATSSGSYCQHHKHLLLKSDGHLPPRLVTDRLQQSANGLGTGSSLIMVHNRAPDGMDISGDAVAVIPIEKSSQDDAPVRGTPELTSGPSDTSLGDISQGQDLITEEANGNVESGGHSEDRDDAAKVSYPPGKPDSTPTTDFSEPKSVPGSNINPVFNSTITENSGNTTNTNYGNTVNKNCGNTTTNNRTSHNIRVQRMVRILSTGNHHLSKLLVLTSRPDGSRIPYCHHKQLLRVFAG